MPRIKGFKWRFRKNGRKRRNAHSSRCLCYHGVLFNLITYCVTKFPDYTLHNLTLTLITKTGFCHLDPFNSRNLISNLTFGSSLFWLISFKNFLKVESLPFTSPLPQHFASPEVPQRLNLVPERPFTVPVTNPLLQTTQPRWFQRKTSRESTGPCAYNPCPCTRPTIPVDINGKCSLSSRTSSHWPIVEFYELPLTPPY